jgi:hypothetical protein
LFNGNIVRLEYQAAQCRGQKRGRERVPPKHYYRESRQDDGDCEGDAEECFLRS